MFRRNHFHNMHIITDVFATDAESNRQICKRYYKEALISLIIKAMSLSEFWEELSAYDEELISDDINYKRHVIIKQRFILRHRTHENDFYVNIFIKTENVLDILCHLDMDFIEKIFKEYYGRKKSKYLKCASRFLITFNEFNSKEKEDFCKRLMNIE